VGWGLALLLLLGVGSGCDRPEPDPAEGVAARRRAARRAGNWIPDELRVQRALALLVRPDGSDERVFTREDSLERASSPSSVMAAVTLLAGLRSGLVRAETRHECNGYGCVRAHGTIGPADALGLSCTHFFDALSARLGSGAFGATFAALGLPAPPVPEDPALRGRFGARGEGWTLTPRQALPLARAFLQRPAPWPEVMDEALVPRVTDPGPLRGVAGSDELSGWFVGYVTTPEPRLVVTRVAGCAGRCADEAIRVGRWAVERLRPAAPEPRGPATDAGTASGRRRRR
jgi:hypothetical protein